MDTLPPELISRIVPYLIEETRLNHDVMEHLPVTSLAAYAVISRRWQHIVETITFRYLHLSPTRLAIAEANNHLTPTRLGYVRRIWFYFEFPAHNYAVSTDPDDNNDQFVFNKTIRQLFGVLSRIPVKLNPSVALHLIILTDNNPSDSDDIQDTEEWKIFTGKDHTTYLQLSLDWDSDISELPAISYLRTELSSKRVLFSPYSINLISSKMNRLEAVEWELSDAEKIDPDLRIRQRTSFAQTLERIPNSLKSFKLKYVREPPRNQYFRPPSIIPPNSPGDILSQALFHFTQRDGLCDFELDASVDSTLFWPQTQDFNKNWCWPTLTNFSVELHDVLPSGQWITVALDPGQEDSESPNGYESDEWENDIPGEETERSFSSVCDQGLMNEFALAAGKSVSHMQNIKWLFISQYGGSGMGIEFTRYKDKESTLELKRIDDVGNPMEPGFNDETLNAWSEAMKAHNLEWKIEKNE
ncbi:hypothetical protein BKA56DRAFT_665568 [Ilyonectria sp. MPI-CAGE-AT-0026]|nr:hypothetical protein BKA56DRAFT_665568 [Ilyonectria sp. MPI-CAGE-AT-0026]